MKTVRFLLASALAWAAGQAAAQPALEVIPLRHSTAEQVLPALRPLLEPGGTLSGQYSQLIVRASPANIAELRRALDAIDRPRRRLQILVRFDDSMAAARETIETRGRVSSRGSRFDVRVEDSSSGSEGRIDQRVQVLEGARALIAAGQTRPVLQRQRIQTPAGVLSQETFVVHEAANGFEVSPRVAGERVFLDIAPRRQSFVEGGGAAPGTIETQRIASSVSARMGEWFEIGGAVSSAMREGRTIGFSSRARSDDTRRIWVKIEEIRN
jgi:type II secretory pathway component GspD/PulD (secretin)